MNRSKMTAFYGLLTALALIMSYIEAQIPAFFAVPGMKLGLTNIVVLTALYLLGERSAVIINIVRIALAAAMFGNGVSFLFSLAGGCLSCLVMMLLKRTGRLSVVAVSAAGGVSHNVGQILVAMLMLHTAGLAWYLLILWFSGMASGLVIGILGGLLIRRLAGQFPAE